MNHKQSNQGGSVVSFLVVGVVLVALVAGGLYLLQHRNNDTASTPTAMKSTSVSPSVALKPSTSAKPSPSPSKSASPATQPPSTNQSADKSAAQNTAPTTQAALPATGPSDMTMGGFVAAIMAASAAAFIQSVRARRNLFHQ